MDKRNYYKKLFIVGAIWNWCASIPFILLGGPFDEDIEEERTSPMTVLQTLVLGLLQGATEFITECVGLAVDGDADGAE